MVVAFLFVGMGCTPSNKKTDGQDVPAIEISDMDEGTVEVHENLLPLDADEENLTHSYYNRETDEDGNSVYVVKQSSNNAYVNLPTSETVLYTISEGENYYEKVVYQYKENGEEKMMTQYQLYIVEK